MLSSIYKCIRKRILDNLEWITAVDMFQQQDIFQSESLGYKCPVIFIDFQDIEYETTSHKVQLGTMNVVVKLVVEDYTRNYLKALDQKIELNNYLNFWSDWDFNMERINESTDSDADSLYVFEIVYQTSFYEENYTWDKTPIGGTNGNPIHGTEGTAWGIDIDLYLNDTLGGTINLDPES